MSATLRLFILILALFFGSLKRSPPLLGRRSTQPAPAAPAFWPLAGYPPSPPLGRLEPPRGSLTKALAGALPSLEVLDLSFVHGTAEHEGSGGGWVYRESVRVSGGVVFMKYRSRCFRHFSVVISARPPQSAQTEPMWSVGSNILVALGSGQLQCNTLQGLQCDASQAWKYG